MGISLAVGCGASKEQARPASGPPSAPQAAAAREPQVPAPQGAEKPSAANAAALAKADPEGLKELSAEDRALAQKQAVCPVSKEPLGSMGKPVKLVHSGRIVFLCCSGCEEDFRKEPEKYLAQLGAGKQPGQDPGHHSAH